MARATDQAGIQFRILNSSKGAAVRATREARVRRGREELPCIIGVPEAGEVVGGEVFDGTTEAAMFPGDLPADPNQVFGPKPTFRGVWHSAQ